MLKAILVGFQNKKRRAIQKASFILENTYVIMNRVLVGTVRGLLVRFQMERRNLLLEAEGKAIIVIKWQRTRLHGFVMVELVNYEIGYLAEDRFLGKALKVEQGSPCCLE